MLNGNCQQGCTGIAGLSRSGGGDALPGIWGFKSTRFREKLRCNHRVCSRGVHDFFVRMSRNLINRFERVKQINRPIIVFRVRIVQQGRQCLQLAFQGVLLIRHDRCPSSLPGSVHFGLVLMRFAAIVQNLSVSTSYDRKAPDINLPKLTIS